MIHRLFQQYTLDVIGEAAFGMVVDSQNNPEDPYLLKCREMFDNLEKVPFIMIPASKLLGMTVAKKKSVLLEKV